jgi:hypothetical protein
MGVDVAQTRPGGDVRSRSWLRALADGLGWSAPAFGLALFGALLVLFVLWELAWGRLAVARLPGDPEAVWMDARIAVNHILCTAYLAAATVYALRAGQRTRDRVRPLLARGAAAGEGGDERTTLRVAGAVGMLTAVGITFVGPGSVSFDPRTWTAEVAWHRVLSVAMGFLALRLATLLVRQSLNLEIDLLDLSRLSPFTQQGLVNALLILGFLATYALFLVDLAYLGIGVVLLVFTVGVATVGLLAPLLGVHRRIRAARRAELDWCRARIRAARLALEEGAPTPTRLDELVAYEGRIERVGEWPLDTSAVLRFALYLTLPLGSWAGGALVERLVDRLLE